MRLLFWMIVSVLMIAFTPAAPAKLLDKTCKIEGETVKSGGQVLLCKTRGNVLLWSKTNWRKLTFVSETTITRKAIEADGPTSMKSLENECRAKLARKLSTMNDLPISIRTSVSKKRYVVPMHFLGVKTASQVTAFDQIQKTKSSSKFVCRWQSDVTLVELKVTDVFVVGIGSWNAKKSFNELTSARWIWKLKLSN